ncbi:unnamed protein product [Polarella glacialis]|uniref:Uncharacterized protein n=1 Tax=Polarella glacialis TaxID=89957 RepID=A0A813KTY8_POLGL|nr:unnamed protein product [Polarella glacialis]
MDGATAPEALQPPRDEAFGDGGESEQSDDSFQKWSKQRGEIAAVSMYLFHNVSVSAIPCLRSLSPRALETVLCFMGAVESTEALGPAALVRLHNAEPPDFAGACLAVFCKALWAQAHTVTMELYEPAWRSTCTASDFLNWRYTYKDIGPWYVQKEWTEWTIYFVRMTDRSGFVVRRTDFNYCDWGSDYDLSDITKLRALPVETLLESSGEEVLAVLKSVQQRAIPHPVGYTMPHPVGYNEPSSCGYPDYSDYDNSDEGVETNSMLLNILNVPWSRENDLLISHSRFRDVGGASARWLLALEHGIISRFPCLEAFRDGEGLSLLLPAILPYLVRRCKQFELQGTGHVNEWEEVSWEVGGFSTSHRLDTSLVLPPAIWHDPDSEFRLKCEACSETFYWDGPHGQQKGGLLCHLKACQACPIRNLRRILLGGASPPFRYRAFTTKCFDEVCACEFPSWTEFVEHLTQAGDAHAEVGMKEGYHQPMMDTDGKLYLLNHQKLTVRHVTADECETFVLGQWRNWWGTTPRADGAIMPVCPSTTWKDLKGLWHHRGKDASVSSSKHSEAVARLIVERAERRAAEHAAQLGAQQEWDRNERKILEESHKRALEELRDAHARELAEALRKCRAAEGAVVCMTARLQ